MSETIEFKNKETNKTIRFEINKPFVLIFGRNGAGKTTLSRIFSDKEFVFNTDFIYKNIYVESSSEAKIDTSTKESFSSLWIGESIVSIKKDLDELRRKKEIINSALSDLSGSITRLFSEKGITIFPYADLNKQINNEEFKKQEDVSDEEIIKKHVSKIELKTDVIDDNDLVSKIARYKNEAAIKILNDRLMSCSLFKELFLENKESEKNRILQSIIEFNSSIEELTRINNAFKLKDKNKQRAWIKEAIELHQNAEECAFCGGKNITGAIDYWKSIIDSKVNERREALIKCINVVIESCDNILKDKEHLIKLTKNIIESIEKIGLYFVNVKEYISKDAKVPDELAFPDVKTDEIAKANNELLISIQNYLFKPFLNKYEIHQLLLNDYLTKEKKKDEELINALNKDAETIKNNINGYLKELDFDKEIKIVIDKRGSDRKYRFDFENPSTKIATLSDGQKHKLALAIFLASLDSKDLTDKTVVLDDPVVTLDYRAYHSVKSQIKKLTDKPGLKRVIVLTCNISFLYIQLSNLFGKANMEYVELFHLFPIGIKPTDPEIINYDDLTLYKKGIESIDNEKEFCQIAMLNTRIYRLFLDLYLRIKGIPANGNPSDDIQLIPDISESDKEKLHELSTKIVRNCRDSKSTNKDLFESFVNTKEFVSILKFPDLLTIEEMKTLEAFSNNNQKDIECDSKSLLFEIVARANTVLQATNEKYENIKNYMNHPRIQLTSSIVGVDFSDLELKEMQREEKQPT